MNNSWPSGAVLDHWLSVIGHTRLPEDLAELSAFHDLIRHNPKQIVVVGRNSESEWLLENFPVRGVLDDFHSGDTWIGHQVLRTEELREYDMVVNCTSSISAVAVDCHLDALDLRHIAYANLAAFEQSWPVPKYIAETHASFATHVTNWSELLHLLEDDLSRREFGAVCAFRLTGDPRYLEGFSLRIEDQYMEDFVLAPLADPVFLDVGGYHGETSLSFCARVPCYKSVTIYEPSPESAKIAQARTSHMRDITVINRGVGERSSMESFADYNSTSSMFVEHGQRQIRVISLDDEELATADFLKMDIEGWELPALRGSRRLIQRTQPTLAIACYHHGSDPIAILDEVLSRNPEYSVRFRHYTQGWSESVLFFCPRKNGPLPK